MANRPVFVPKKDAPFYEMIDVDFKYYSGFSVSQNRKTINSLHKSFNNLYPDKSILEISSKSETTLGVQLSAFNLSFVEGAFKNATVECVYQSGKIFENGGPYLDLLHKTSKEAKRDPRLYQSGKIIGFRLNEKSYIQNNIDGFYNYLYICALKQNVKLAENTLKYKAFTDIVFNPRKGISCQARSAAMFVGMSMTGITDIEGIISL